MAAMALVEVSTPTSLDPLAMRPDAVLASLAWPQRTPRQSLTSTGSTGPPGWCSSERLPPPCRRPSVSGSPSPRWTRSWPPTFTRERSARRHAYAADSQGYLERGRTERKRRRVGLRPAPDTMAMLTGYLPVEQRVACYAALRRHTDATVAAGDRRTRDQIMADTLVERVTGQSRAVDVDIELQLVIPVDCLTTGFTGGTAQLVGHGPVTAELASAILATSSGRIWWRRLFAAPSGQLVGGDPHRRRFDGWLAQLIGLRDQTCRDPFCDAPIRHIDHIVQRREGGTTTFENGRGTCARGNHVREMPGWQVTLLDPGPGTHRHTTVTTTPTGHQYLSHAADPP